MKSADSAVPAGEPATCSPPVNNLLPAVFPAAEAKQQAAKGGQGKGAGFSDNTNVVRTSAVFSVI